MCDRDGHLFLDCSPKCHCETSGEEIEYAWGCANNHYRGLKKSNKKDKDNVRNSVAESIYR